jgi:hypothetical protein
MNVIWEEEKILKHMGNTERKNVGGSTLEEESPIECCHSAS